MTNKKDTALILAGAAGKGPFAAGALTEIAKRTDFHIRCIVGTSSGALNGAVYAAGLRVGDPEGAATRLQALWRNQAQWFRILTHERRVEVVRNELERYRSTRTHRPVRLRLVTTSLRGIPSPAPDSKYTTFEKDYEFRAEDFENFERIGEMAEAAVASAAIPLVFSPAQVGRQGPYWDGGVVDNAPIAWALEREPTIDHLLVVSKDPKTVPPSSHFSRFSLGRLFEILIEERLTRDMREAHKFNRDLETLQGLGVDMARVRQALGWRHLEIIEIRPTRVTPGGFLSGFFSREERVKNIEVGQESAREAFAACDTRNAVKRPARHPDPLPRTPD